MEEVARDFIGVVVVAVPFRWAYAFSTLCFTWEKREGSTAES